MVISKGSVSESCNQCSVRNLPCPKTNILINNNGHACLTGFSLLTMASDQLSITSPATGHGTIRWTSPELFFPEEFGFGNSHPTKESDCYALGMVIYEVLSGEVPFAAIHLEFGVIVKVLEGERPRRPEGDDGKLFTDGIWEMLNLCWKSQPQDRIDAKAVLLVLEGDTSLLRPTSPNIDEGMETDADEELDAMASDSSMFFLFFILLYMHFNHPSAIIGPLITHNNSGQLDPPQMQGWIGYRLAHRAHKMFKATTKKLYGL